MRRWFVFFCALLCGGVPLASVEAFEVAPAIQELQIQAGATSEREIRLVNPGDEPLEVFFTVQKFRAGGGGAPVFLPSEDTRGLPEWIRVSAPKAQLPPRSSAVIRVRIDVPRAAPSGGYTAAIFVTEASRDGAMVEVAKRIATLWFVTVQGSDGVTAKPEWKIDELTVRSRPEGARAGAAAQISVQNIGNTHGIVAARVEFDGLFMHATSTYRAMRLLPGEARQTTVTMSSLAPIDVLYVTVELPSGERITRRTVVIHPWFFVVFGGLLAGAVGILRWRKRSNRGILVS